MGWLADCVSSAIKIFTEGRALRHESRQKARLREMLNDKRFDFRSTERLMNDIGADRATTERLLVSIGARRSETSDEWTFKPPPSKT